MFKRNKKRQARVEITFKHGDAYASAITPPKEIIELLPGQTFELGIEADRIWEGDTLLREFDWRAGYTRIYDYFYV